ncbi:DNA binding HTH domain, Fis-type [uncultured Caudovirales phage]|uniref:DNA binding HTH domain, Fis-type n=1 Tax=uncultured Caudovirales phage TaxID=2100421 RepID=A0A6J5PAD2_9CAUD|nr:DNA binding HTH domain, Fis-type [uncultured Caudovirales phage]
MAGPKGYTAADYEAAVRIHGNKEKAAKALGINPRTLKRYLNRYLAQNPPVENITELPPDDISADEIWERAKRDSAVKVKYLEAEAGWRKQKLKVKGPFGILFFGDPHLDDAHANFAKAEEHIAIANSSEAILSCNLGDTLNNWVGNLQRLYANQNMGATRALKIYEKFLNSVPWWLWIFGNHCLWPTANSGLMRKLATEGASIAADWCVKVDLELPNGKHLKINAAHNFKGSSRFNQNHALFVENLETGGEADIIVAGDHHVWQTDQVEHPKTGRYTTIIRARGYKLGGEYERMLGFKNQKEGHAVFVIVNPDAEGPAFVTAFADASYGARMLKLLRDDWARGQAKTSPRAKNRGF